MTSIALALWRSARIALLMAVPHVSYACQSSSASKAASKAEAEAEATAKIRPPESPRPEATHALTPSGGAPVPEAVGDRPSVDENMGRGFQGSLKLLLRTASGEHGLRYMSRGNRARLQLDAVSNGAASQGQRPEPTAVNFDALIWDQNISLLDNRHQTFQTFALDDVKVTTEPEPDVDIEKTGERVSLLGVFCERYEITQALQHISSCVSALPGAFDVDKLEAVSGIDVPAWAEQLLEEGMLPLTASARGSESREEYSLELVEYSADPAPESMLTLPATYHAKPLAAAPPRDKN